MTKQHFVVVTANQILQKTTMHDNYSNSVKNLKHRRKSIKCNNSKTNIIQFFPKSLSENSYPHQASKHSKCNNNQNYIQLRDICQLFNDDRIKSKITAAAKQIINEINNDI